MEMLNAFTHFASQWSPLLVGGFLLILAFPRPGYKAPVDTDEE